VSLGVVYLLGLLLDEIAWLMRNAPHEVVAVRPDPTDRVDTTRATTCGAAPRLKRFRCSASG
jgi:hypothetical protein